ncbi:MAG: DUF4445 domain-containing protein, partial [Acidobacteria bacterium]|nr:DUF4445 domain-containing protein [Acidobacteriota bacterium]
MTLFDLADQRAIPVPTSCGRAGACHECIVDVKRGAEALSPPSPAEAFLRGKYRLACQAEVLDPNAELAFAVLQRRPKILVSTERSAIPIDPPVQRAGDRVTYNGEDLDEYRGGIYGVAMDLGTTTMVLEIIDLETGAVKHVTSLENPQRFGGSDVMNRISYDAGPYKGELHKAAIHALNHELTAACKELGITRHMIYEAVIAGNSTMRDLFFGLDVQPIGQRPYKSVIEEEWRAGKRTTTALTTLAHKLGVMMHPKGRIYGGPLIASHVGADTAAALLAIDFDTIREPFLLVDIGTNTEVVAGYNGRYVAASCPAGPAFEGGLVEYGMPGCEGAIEAVRYDGTTWHCETIGNVAPQGICGSGLIDLLAELRRHQLMTPMGVFPARRAKVELVSGITLSREDASHLAQAKSANYCGQFIVLRHLGLRPADVRCLYLAGAFANYVSAANAIDIGFLAPVPQDRI